MTNKPNGQNIVPMIKIASYADLLAGCSTFKDRVMKQDSSRFESLASSQSPKVTFLTCSDSRIDPCAMTNTNPGDLFVIRNAGNIVPPDNGTPCGELASLEFAVRGLKTQHIVVCGHTDCGAMKGMLNPGSCSHLTHVAAWTQLATEAGSAADDPTQKLNAAIRANVTLQLKNLRKLEFIREAEEAGTLALHGWVFDIATGEVEVVEESAAELPATS